MKLTKEILHPMETFTPIAMKCTQEQFDAVKPKLKGLNIEDINSFYYHNYLINNLGGQEKTISNISEFTKGEYNREVHEEWNEKIFLEACGIEAETLQEKEQRLLKELEEVRNEIEDSKIKVGDWVKNNNNIVFKVEEDKYDLGVLNESKEFKKITNTEIINCLENLYNEQKQHYTRLEQTYCL